MTARGRVEFGDEGGDGLRVGSGDEAKVGPLPLAHALAAIVQGLLEHVCVMLAVDLALVWIAVEDDSPRPRRAFPANSASRARMSLLSMSVPQDRIDVVVAVCAKRVDAPLRLG